MLLIKLLLSCLIIIPTLVSSASIVNLKKRGATVCDAKSVYTCQLVPRQNKNGSLSALTLKQFESPTFSNFVSEQPEKWFEVWKYENTAIYGQVGKCLLENGLSCFNSFKVLYGDAFNATYYTFRSNLTAKVILLAIENHNNFTASVGRAVYNPNQSIASIVFGNGVRIQIMIIKGSIHFTLHGRRPHAGDSSESGMCKNPVGLAYYNEAPTDYPPNLNLEEPILQGPSTSCFGSCQSKSSGVIHQFEAHNATFSTVSDNRLGWIYLMTSYGFRILKRQVLCKNSTSPFICTDKVFYAPSFRERREFSLIGNSIVQTVYNNQNGTYSSSNSSAFEFSIRDMLKIIISISEDGNGINVELKANAEYPWPNENGACGSFPGQVLQTTLRETTYARLIDIDIKATTVENIYAMIPKDLAVKPEMSDSFRFDNNCFTLYQTSATGNSYQAFVHHNFFCRTTFASAGYLIPAAKRTPVLSDFSKS